MPLSHIQVNNNCDYDPDVDEVLTGMTEPSNCIECYRNLILYPG